MSGNKENLTIFQRVARALNNNPKAAEEELNAAPASFTPPTNGGKGNYGGIKQPRDPRENQQQEFLDWQVQSVARDLYSRTIYFDADRTSSYYDFRAMDQSPEIASALDIIRDECLEASTVIPLLNGDKRTIEDLYESGEENFYVYSYNPELGQVEPAECERVTFKGEQDVYKVTFDDDSYALATSEHLWLLRGKNEYAKTSELSTGDSIEIFYKDEFFIDKNDLKSIEFVGKRKTYDLVNVGDYHNFAILTSNGNSGVFTHNCLTRNERGNILEIYSENDRVKEVLNDLFKNRLNAEFNMRLWIRDLCKYGDFFLHLHIDKDYGIFDVMALPAEEIHREEGVDNQASKTQFRWDTQGMRFEEWQIAHFRLLEDTRRIPYGRCLAFDTYIDSPDGPKWIQDIQKGDLVYSFDKNTCKKIETKVLDTVCSGEKEIYSIRTKNNEIESSEDHYFLICNKDGEFSYKPVYDLSVGDFLVIDKSINFEGEPIRINKKLANTKNFNGYRNNIDLIPDVVNEDFANLFGFMIGDGWVCNNDVFFALGMDENMNKKYISLLEKFSGKKHCLMENANKEGSLKYSQVKISSKMLKEVLENNGFGGKSYEKRVPKWIFKTSYSIKKSFVDGLVDADGSVFIDKWNCKRYSIELANEHLIKDVKFLLQTMGIKTGKVCRRQRKDGYIWGVKYKKRESFYFYFYESFIKQSAIHETFNKKSDEFIIKPITSVKNTNIKKKVYDIQVEDDNHNFYANGIVVHNSILDPARKLWKQLQLCLAKDTKILATNGYIEIQNLKEGDEIYSYDYEAKDLVKTKIKRCWKTSDDKKLYKIHTENSELEATDNHPILTFDGDKASYKTINEIDIEKDRVVYVGWFKDEPLYDKIKTIEYSKNDEVWDLEVESDLHNFVANGVVVHNCEDAMMVYRLTRAADRRVFYIDVGNIDDADVLQYVEDVKTKLKRQPVVNQNDGGTNRKYNPPQVEEDYFIPVRGDNSSRIETLQGACLALDTKIELLDGRSLTLSEIISEFKEGKDLWSYSINPENGEVVPGEITWAGVTRKDTQVLKIKLDNGEYITCTPDHKFPTKYNGIKEAKDLVEGESLWSFNKKVDDNYEMVYDHFSNTWKIPADIISGFYDFRNSVKELYNHKIESIEWITEKQDTGTITIDGKEKLHDFHNFALSSGVFTQNSNMDQIADIEYLEDKLFAAIKVPKPYLNYHESMPGGSLLSQSDLRFSRTINMIQECVLMEMRRIANTHLLFLGFEDDIDNFTLQLTNPSTQQTLLNMETWKSKLEVFKDMFTPEGVSPTSYTWAMENILDFSKEQIKLMLKQKKIEKKIFMEIESAPETYKKIGLFKDLDRKYENPHAKIQAPDGDDDTDFGGGGDSFGGGSIDSDLASGGLGDAMGDEDTEFGDTDTGEDLGGEDIGGEEDLGGDEEEGEELSESFKRMPNKSKRLQKGLSESDARFEGYFDQLFSETKDGEERSEKNRENKLLKNNASFSLKKNRLKETLDRMNSKILEEQTSNPSDYEYVDVDDHEIEEDFTEQEEREKNEDEDSDDNRLITDSKDATEKVNKLMSKLNTINRLKNDNNKFNKKNLNN